MNDFFLKPFLLALQFLTRIPVPKQTVQAETKLGQSVLYYPLVGLLIGSLLLLIAVLLQTVPVNVLAAMLLSFWVLVTGGLHLDGLADCADAWVGGLGDKQRSLAIMKDSAAGPMAVIVLVLVLLLKWAGIAECLSNNDLLLLLVTPALGRLSIIALMLGAPYIRKDGLGSELVRQLPRQKAYRVLAISSVLISFAVSMNAVLITMLVFFLIRYMALQRLGGVTGDVYGACVELVESAVIIVGIL